MHSGHRQRLKKQFLENGLDGFTDVQVLELLLFFAVPRVDTNPLAHRLLDDFGSLDRVLDASFNDLCEIEGVGENAATFLTLLTAASRYYQVRRAENVHVLDSVVECGEYLCPFFHGRTNETVFLLCMDAKCKVLACKEIGEGGVNCASISVRKIVETALVCKASCVVLAHNHPSGFAIPSTEDVLSTQRIAKALAAVEIALIDHIIVAEDDFVTLGQSGLYKAEDYFHG